ncbi:hypothetical protein [Streptacidiphilus sp. MAP12-16]|uniref:hypothetical protein n=1 Tax=Streptacidiphilus sp. MAP12-16 TaxID=3156300 RepID=UPI003516F791
MNLGWTTDGGQTITRVTGGETTLPGEGPALDSDGRGVFVAWTNSTYTLTIAYYDGTALTCKTRLSGVISPHSPALANDGSGTRYVAWADGTGHLNFAKVNSANCRSPGTITLTRRNRLPNTTVAGPALVNDSTSAGLGIVVAWAGTDSAHTLNVASYVDSATLAHKVSVAPNPPAASASAPGLASASSDLYLGFRGTDGKVYTAYSEGCIPSCFSAGTDGTLAGSPVGMTGGQHTWLSYFDSGGRLVLKSF